MRQQFNSGNNKSKILRFQKSGATSSFVASTTFIFSNRRPSFRFFNGVETTQIAGNNVTYTGFTSDTSIRDVEMRFYTDRTINLLQINGSNLYGNFDLSPLSGTASSFQVSFSNNPNLTGVTNFPIKTASFYGFNSNLTNNITINSPNIVDLRVNGNPNLTGITHVIVTANTSVYDVNTCNLTGNLDLTVFTNFGGQLSASNNPNLTGITHTSSNRSFTSYSVNSCNLTGSLNLSMLTNLAGQFQAALNPNLTGITHTASSQNFSQYSVYSCNLTGNLNLPFSGLGGVFTVYNNPNLTGITHIASSRTFTQYDAYSCNLSGNLILPFSGLGGIFRVHTNPNLTGITHVTSTQDFTIYDAYSTNLSGTLDLSPLKKLGNSSSGTSTYSILRVHSNPNLTNIIFPANNQYFRNFSNIDGNAAFALYSCNLDYIDFKPLSGATLISGTTLIGLPRIVLASNNMTAGDVNHILDDFLYNATNNSIGWSNINLNIGGTNSAPDFSSGGYNGIAAVNALTNPPYNWTITHS
jgi:hypothetical protein